MPRLPRLPDSAWLVLGLSRYFQNFWRDFVLPVSDFLSRMLPATALQQINAKVRNVRLIFASLHLAKLWNPSGHWLKLMQREQVLARSWRFFNAKSIRHVSAIQDKFALLGVSQVTYFKNELISSIYAHRSMTVRVNCRNELILEIRHVGNANGHGWNLRLEAPLAPCIGSVDRLVPGLQIAAWWEKKWISVVLIVCHVCCLFSWAFRNGTEVWWWGAYPSHQV